MATDATQTDQITSDQAVISAPKAVDSGPAPRIRLEYLDGVRGVASLYVMLTHLVLFINTALFTEVSWLAPATAWMRYGRTSVAIFIVLSGYCLMLPVARTEGYVMEGGFWPYLMRRARRIMPPYYAAVAIALGLMYVFSGRIDQIGSFWQTMKPTGGKVLLSHLLLIHNFSNDWITRIDAPMWSVATEWQIYFLFPMILLPLFRKSTSAMLAAALIIGIAPMAVFKTGETAAPWFVLLFGLGMVGASINFTAGKRWNGLKERINWQAMCVVSVGSAVLWHFFLGHRPSLKWKGELIEDVLTGLATMSLLIACTNGVQKGVKSYVVNLLDAKPLLFLGAISYSLYLMHVPILGTLDICIRALNVPQQLSAILYLFGGIAAAIGVTYLFHLVFERPFMRRRPSQRRT